MPKLSRRRVLQGAVAVCGAATFDSIAAQSSQFTNFQIACMTLPYADFPLDRALTGIVNAGYRYVAWGTTHKNSSRHKEPVMARDADPVMAKRLGDKCRNLGLTPVTMFSEVYVAAPDSVKVHTCRIEQAAAAQIPFVLTFGSVQGDERRLWIANLKQLGPIARGRRDNRDQTTWRKHCNRGDLRADR